MSGDNIAQDYKSDLVLCEPAPFQSQPSHPPKKSEEDEVDGEADDERDQLDVDDEEPDPAPFPRPRPRPRKPAVPPWRQARIPTVATAPPPSTTAKM